MKELNKNEMEFWWENGNEVKSRAVVTCSRRFSFHNGEFHVLDFDSHQQEVDFANYHIF